VDSEGQAISLDGFDDYVNIDGYKGVLADAAGVQQAVTICAWIKTATNAMDIVTWGTNVAGQRMSFRVDTVIRVEHGSGNIRGTNGPSLLDDEWHHVAATVPRGATMMDVRLYVDGLDVSGPGSSTAAFNLTANVDVAIGMGGPAAARFFNGLIDDARIYDRDLSAGVYLSSADGTTRACQAAVGPPCFAQILREITFRRPDVWDRGRGVGGFERVWHAGEGQSALVIGDVGGLSA